MLNSHKKFHRWSDFFTLTYQHKVLGIEPQCDYQQCTNALYLYQE